MASSWREKRSYHNPRESQRADETRRISTPSFPNRPPRQDIRARSPNYWSDWTEEALKGRQALTRIAAASIYIFFASAVPAIAFGQQLEVHKG